MPKLRLLSNRPISPIDTLDDDELLVDDYIALGRIRRTDQYGKLVQEELPDHICFQLLVIRLLALKKYKEANNLA